MEDNLVIVEDFVMDPASDGKGFMRWAHPEHGFEFDLGQILSSLPEKFFDKRDWEPMIVDVLKLATAIRREWPRKKGFREVDEFCQEVMSTGAQPEFQRGVCFEFIQRYFNASLPLKRQVFKKQIQKKTYEEYLENLEKVVVEAEEKGGEVIKKGEELLKRFKAKRARVAAEAARLEAKAYLIQLGVGERDRESIEKLLEKIDLANWKKTIEWWQGTPSARIGGVDFSKFRLDELEAREMLAATGSDPAEIAAVERYYRQNSISFTPQSLRRFVMRSSAEKKAELKAAGINATQVVDEVDEAERLAEIKGWCDRRSEIQAAWWKVELKETLDLSIEAIETTIEVAKILLTDHPNSLLENMKGEIVVVKQLCKYQWNTDDICDLVAGGRVAAAREATRVLMEGKKAAEEKAGQQQEQEQQEQQELAQARRLR